MAGSALIVGEVHVGAGAVLAQGLVVRAHGGAVSIGNYSAILENGVVIGTPGYPVRVGQRTVFGHRAAIVGATVGDLCEIGNGAILRRGPRLGSGCILGEGTLLPPGTVVPAGSVLVGRPPHVIRSATDADRERLAVLRQHQTDLTDHPATAGHGPMRAGEDMGTLYAYRDKTPAIGPGTVLFDSAEITGDVVIGEGSLIGAGVKIIGDSHGPVRIGSRVQILENTVLHLLPDNELIIEDDAVIGPGAMIHGCHIGRGSIVEPGAIVGDHAVIGPRSIVRAGSVVKQRSAFPAQADLDGFPATLVGALTGPPPLPPPVAMIRRAGPGDVDALRAIAAAAYQKYVPRIGQNPAPMTADYAQAVRDQQAWAAMQDGNVAGFAILIPRPGYLLLENVAVLPAAQGHGIGARLLG